MRTSPAFNLRSPDPAAPGSKASEPPNSRLIALQTVEQRQDGQEAAVVDQTQRRALQGTPPLDAGKRRPPTAIEKGVGANFTFHPSATLSHQRMAGADASRRRPQMSSAAQKAPIKGFVRENAVLDVDRLVDFHELLDWQKDNEFILSGYRRATFDFRRCTRSMLSIHNETVNIWSHALGTLAYSAIPLYLYTKISAQYENADTLDLTMIALFFASVTVCFLFSAFYHVFLNHSPRVWRVASHLDHLGIVLVIWGSTVPSAHFGFHDEPRLQKTYALLATVFAAASAYATFKPTFRTGAGRRFRVLLYALLGLSAFASAIHGLFIHGLQKQNQRMSLDYFLGLGLLNGTGAAIYGARIPERWFPRRFDIYGSSHQIMHVLVMCGALSHSIGLVKAWNYWSGPVS